MSVRMIQERFHSYGCASVQEEDHALREITQELILAALSRTSFFARVLFQGGTCLRIFHGLNRFSEDLDFILKNPDPDFSLTPFLSGIKSELEAYGYRAEITDRSSADSAVRKAFIKDDSLGKVLQFSITARSSSPKKVKVKIEVDVNPPGRSGADLRYLDFPFFASVAVQDLPSLFAGKLHALLCREYIKGRDWYDFLWYTARGVVPNYQHLSLALSQTGPWQGQEIEVDAAWVAQALTSAITRTDWITTAADVRRFVPTSEHPSLELWSTELFLGQVHKIR